MEKFAVLLAAFPLACGLAFAQTESPEPSKTATQSAAASPSSSGTVTLANVQSWRGTLVDANCTGGAAASSSTASSSSTGAEKESSDSQSASDKDATKGAVKPHKDHRNRTDPNQAQGCSVTNSTSAFALKTKEGQTLKFDGVGNTRAAEELKVKWSKELSAGKPIHAKVTGSINGDTVTVTSVD
jgi:hypothetical protein